MSIWNPLTWGRAASRLGAKASAAGSVVSAWQVGQPVWTPRDYESLAREAYLRNAVAYRCVKLIATSGAAIGLLLHDADDNEIEKHPALDLLARPNPATGAGGFFEAMLSHLLLAGNAYVEAVGPDRRPPRELWLPRPDRMRVIPGEMGLPRGYEYTHGGRSVRWDVDPVRGTSRILHIRDFHPVNDWYGMSRIEAAAYGVDRHNASGAHNKALLDNGARPSGALVFEPVKVQGEDGLHQQAPQAIIDDAYSELRKRHGGPENAGRPMVLNGLVKWLEMGTSPKDMDFAASKADAARDICTAIGVPHVLIVPGSATYNNVREAKLELYEETVLPLVETVCDDLTNWLLPMFGDTGLRLTPDLDTVSALEPRRAARRTSLLELVNAGILDTDEAREALQYGPRPATAVEKVDAAVLTALIQASETTGLTPLVRYMRSVGLVPPGATEESVAAEALRLIEDDMPQDDEEPPAQTEGQDE
jgi:HK97 family phage portal protein